VLLRQQINRACEALLQWLLKFLQERLAGAINQ